MYRGWVGGGGSADYLSWSDGIGRRLRFLAIMRFGMMMVMMMMMMMLLLVVMMMMMMARAPMTMTVVTMKITHRVRR